MTHVSIPADLRNDSCMGEFLIMKPDEYIFMDIYVSITNDEFNRTRVRENYCFYMTNYNKNILLSQSHNSPNSVVYQHKSTDSKISDNIIKNVQEIFPPSRFINIQKPGEEIRNMIHRINHLISILIKQETKIEDLEKSEQHIKSIILKIIGNNKLE
jgi:hypothetical protein